jgi:MPBQ/MSBQ methyltransferase
MALSNVAHDFILHWGRDGQPMGRKPHCGAALLSTGIARLIPADDKAAAGHASWSGQDGHRCNEMDSEPGQNKGEEMIAVETPVITEAVVKVPSAHRTPRIGLEQYYSEAGPDYAAWSREFNMHFGYYRAGSNPLHREAMLEQMNAEVLARLQLGINNEPRLLDLGCGLGATLRSFARRLPRALLLGLTRVPWQVERARALNETAGCSDRVRIMEGDYEGTTLQSASYDGVYALESSCHARSADKGALLAEAHRLLRPGGRLVVADGFLAGGRFANALQYRVYRKLCECWVIEELAQLRLFTLRLGQLGFTDITVEHLQMRVAPSVAHIPWVTLRFLLTDVMFGKRKMNRARWNNVLAPVLLPLVSAPLGPMTYCMITAKKS